MTDVSNFVTDANGRIVYVGSVVQIDPEHDERFAACFMVVQELKPSWNGLIGYIQVPGINAEQAYYRVNGENVVKIGEASWTIEIDS